MTDSTPAATTDEEVLITRVFDATRERVFRAWTDPEEVAAWYGPSISTRRASGSTSTCASAGDTSSRWSNATVAPSLRSATTSSSSSSRSCSSCARTRCPRWACTSPPITRVEFHDHGAKTRMTLTDGPYPAGGGHAEAGWNSAFDKLDDADRRA